MLAVSFMQQSTIGIIMRIKSIRIFCGKCVLSNHFSYFFVRHRLVCTVIGKLMTVLSCPVRHNIQYFIFINGNFRKEYFQERIGISVIEFPCVVIIFIDYIIIFINKIITILIFLYFIIFQISNTIFLLILIIWGKAI